jgi:hypothetical protein
MINEAQGNSYFDIEGICIPQEQYLPYVIGIMGAISCAIVMYVYFNVDSSKTVQQDDFMYGFDIV